MANRNLHSVDTSRAEFIIFSDGEQLGAEFGILSILISKAVNTIPTAQITMRDGSPAMEDFTKSSGDLLIPGKEIEIQAGYNQDYITVFKGIVIKHGIQSKLGKASMLILDLKDISVKMTIGRKNRYFEDVTDSDVIEEILGEYDVTPDVESMSITHPEMVQYFNTDWDFILSRADINGKLVFVDDGSVTIKEPDLSQEPKKEIFYGTNVYGFQAEMDARDQYAGITGRSWDYANQEIIEAEGEDPGITEQGNISGSELADVIGLDAWPLQHSGQILDQELEAWANAKFLRSRLSKIKGDVKVLGLSDVKPGDLIELGGIGDRFNGTAFVSAISHEFTSTSAWYTTIEFGYSQKWYACRYTDIIEEPAAGLVPGVQGLQIGIVTNIHEDPDGEDRVKVRIPIINADDEGVWARVSTLDAGDNRGSFFRPEVTDEVIVGFLNDDPRDPIILGMVNSSAKPAPLTAEEDNNEKGFITRSEIKLIFNDDEKSVIIETPNGNKATLSDDEGGIILEDENSNKIEMTSDGITIESGGDINISTSTGDVNIEGLNIANSATAQFSADGTAGAEITSSGVASIAGSQTAIG
jgi:Rhs element Vgr protein